MIPLALAALMLTPAAGDDPGKTRDAQQCPALFGSPAAREANAAWREGHLHKLAITDKRIEITHSVGRWGQPKALRMTGIELLDVKNAESDTPVAVVSVDESLQSICEPGVYEIAADDALGQGGQVLVVDERGVLVEQGGKLAFLPWAGHPLPTQMRMVWRSPYNIILQTSGKGGGGSKASQRKSAKKSKARKKPARKRKSKKRK